MAGIVPGILVGLSLMVCSFVIALRRGYPTESLLSFGEVTRSFMVCLPALFAPVIILGSIFTGIVTPTEAAVIAVMYAIVVGRWVYGDLEWRMIPEMLRKTGEMTAAMMLIIGAGDALAWVLTVENFSQIFSQWIVSLAGGKFHPDAGQHLPPDPGRPMPLAPALLLTTPILLPLVKGVGVDPLHFGMIVVCNLAISICSPPVGNTLFIAAKLARGARGATSLALIPFILINIVDAPPHHLLPILQPVAAGPVRE